MDTNWIQKLRDLAGYLSARLTKKDYHRFQMGQRVGWFNPDTGLWDEGEITAVRVAGIYVVRDPEYKDHLVEWQNLRPIK